METHLTSGLAAFKECQGCLTLQVSMDRIKTVQLNEPILVEGVRVTFIDANHCPGSAMILFQVPGQRAVLHTGDCRHDHLL